MKTVTLIVLGALAVWNVFSFLLMRHDKQCAKQNKRRVPEKTLFAVAALFGAFGGTLGMVIFRHKTRHWYFVVFFPVMMVIQAAVIGYLWSRGVL